MRTDCIPRTVLQSDWSWMLARGTYLLTTFSRAGVAKASYVRLLLGMDDCGSVQRWMVSFFVLFPFGECVLVGKVKRGRVSDVLSAAMKYRTRFSRTGSRWNDSYSSIH